MIDLDELMRLHAAATPGPWKVATWYGGYHTIRPKKEPEKSLGQIERKADAAYIVAACNAVPELVARIRKLESEIKRRDAQSWADLCNECESDGSCPYLVTCPFDEKKCGDVRPADWLKWMEEKK